jgi:hypothetical protein
VANSQTITINTSFTRGSNTALSRSYSKTIAPSNAFYSLGVQTIGTSDETVTLNADLSALGYIFAVNLDATNYVELGYTSGTYFGMIKAGEACAFRAGSGLSTIHAKANTGACDVEFFVTSA